MLHPSHNYVLIRPDAHHVAGTHGLVIEDDFDPVYDYGVTGTVVAVCDKLLYHGDKVRAMKKRVLTANEEMEMYALQRSGVTFDAPIEVKVGDRVAFPYLYHVADSATSDYEHSEEGLLLIDYEVLVARIDEGGDLYPLNGRVFGTHAEEKSRGMVLRTDNKKSDLYVITHEGCLVKSYSDWGDGDTKNGIVGRKAIVQSKIPVSLEVPHQVRLTEERIYYFHRRHILGYL